MQQALETIKQIVGSDNLWHDHAARLAYSRAVNYSLDPATGVLPLAIARPTHLRQLARLLVYCSEKRIPIAIRGAGLAPVANALPKLADTLVILTTGLNRIYEISGREIRLQCGACAGDLAQKAGVAGLCWPHAENMDGIATIGGILAMNEAGAGYPALGAPADHVAALEVYRTNGEKFVCHTANGLPPSLAPGLPLANILCGSKGALAFIGDIWLRLELAPGCRKSFLAICEDWQAALAGARFLLANTKFQPQAVEIFNPVCADSLLAQKSPWLLYFTLAAPNDDIMTEWLDDCQMDKASLMPLSRDFPGKCAGLLAALNVSLGAYDIYAPSCPAENLPEMLEKLLELLKDHNYGMIILPGIARITLCVARKERSGESRLAREIFALELMLNGQMTDEKEYGQERENWQKSHDDGQKALAQALRQFLDPAAILSAHSLPNASGNGSA